MGEYTLSVDGEFLKMNKNSTYLIVMGIDKEPPHIGWIANGKYYANSSRGGKFGFEALRLLEILKKKETPSLIIELKGTFLIDYADYFSPAPLNKGESCLLPIIDLLHDCGSLEMSKGYLFDVLKDDLFVPNIKNVMQMNAKNMIRESRIILKTYGQSEIDEAIQDARLC